MYYSSSLIDFTYVHITNISKNRDGQNLSLKSNLGIDPGYCDACLLSGESLAYQFSILIDEDRSTGCTISGGEATSCDPAYL